MLLVLVLFFNCFHLLFVFYDIASDGNVTLWERAARSGYKLQYVFCTMSSINNLDYCSLIWSNTSNVNINKITKLQRRSCKLILGQEYNGLIEALERLNMLSFDQSIFLSKAKLIYKIQNNLAPAYLNEMFLMRDITLNNTASNLRSVTKKTLLLPQAKCNLFKGSLSYSGVIVWNSIPVSIKNSSSLTVFVKRCTEWMKH